MLHELDTSGLLCPYPLTMAKKCLKKLKKGDKLQVISTDPASIIDFNVFTEVTEDVLLEKHYYDSVKKHYVFIIEKH